MKKIISLCLLFALILTLSLSMLVSCGGGNNNTDDSENESKKESESESESESLEKASAPAFEGSVNDILDAIVARACELYPDEYGIAGIECTDVAVDVDSCTTILGLTDEEFTNFVEAAVESKPNGSWYTHSVVVIQLKDGTNVEEVANKIVANTKPNRFGCLKPHCILGCYAGNFVIFAASDDDSCEAVYNAAIALSAVTPTRIERENTWTGMGGLLG